MDAFSCRASSWLTAHVYLLCPHTVEGARHFSGAPLIRALIALMRALLLCPYHFLKAPPPNTKLVIRISTHKFWETQIFSPYCEQLERKPTIEPLACQVVFRI